MKNLTKIPEKSIKEIAGKTKAGSSHADFISAVLAAQVMNKAVQLSPPEPLRGIGKIRYWFWRVYRKWI